MAAGWRQMYNEWEKAVAPGLEQLTSSDAFRDMMAVGMQISRSVMSETEKLSRQWLHMWNLPAAGDVRKLRRQISSLDREVQALRRSLELATSPASVEISPDLTVVPEADLDADEPAAEAL